MFHTLENKSLLPVTSYKLQVTLLLVFFVFLSVFLLLQISINNFWSNDDPYYHAKHALLIEQTGNLTLVEPWLEFHFLNYAPTDPWWGFHLLQAAAIRLFGDPILGSKFLAAVLAALVFVVIYGILRAEKVQRPFFWTLLFMLSSASFLFRLLLARPLLLGMSLLPLAWYLAVKKKYVWLFILVLIYTLLYNLASVMVFVIGLYALTDYFFNKRLDLKLIIAGAGGFLAGIFLHPYSLNYVYVMFIHFWQVLYLKFSGIDLNVGTEIQTADFSSFIRFNNIIVMLYLGVMAFLLATRRSHKKTEWYLIYSLAAISGFWLVITLFVPRGVEYWAPFAWLFIVLAAERLTKLNEWMEIKKTISRRIAIRPLKFFVLEFFVVMIAFNGAIFTTLIPRHNQDETAERFEQAAAWLENNTQPNEIIYYTNWSFWPMMFFYNHYNRYVTGMDPTFLYDYDPKLFWVWQNINARGFYCDQPPPCLDLPVGQAMDLVAPAVRQLFKSNYILTENDPQQALFQVLQSRPNEFSRVFENKKLVIFEIKNN